MNFSTYLRGSILIILFGIIYSITPATAQNYYPADIGNAWVMESADGKEKRTYTLETPEDGADQEYTLLKIVTEDLEENEVDIDRYFVTTDEEGIKLHKTVITYGLIAVLGDIVADFSPPVIFFRNVLSEGDKWKIVADAKIPTTSPPIELASITNLEVEGFEDVVTPAGDFFFCAKVKLVVEISGVLNQTTTSYQWLAPDVGPIKYENSVGLVYELVSYNLQTPPQEPEDKTPPQEPEDTEKPEVTEEELEILEEEENQETVTEYDDMTYEQPTITEPEPEEEVEDTMDDSEMTPEPEEEIEDTMDDPEMTPEPEVGTEEMVEDPEPTPPEPEEEVEDTMDDSEMTPETEVEDDIEEINPYDVTGDGVVNILDLVRVASHFGEENPEVDVTGDGIVNILDLVAIAQNFSG